MTITPEQRQAVVQAGDSPVHLDDPQTGHTYVLLRADVFLKLRESLEDMEDRRDHEAWAKLARHAREQWAASEAYPLMDQVLAEGGWDDPAMDVYDDYAPKEQS